MRIVVTGAGGFIGERLARVLLGADGLSGQSVTRLVLVDRSLTPSSDPRVMPIEGDLGEASVRREMLAEGADVVFHLAAVPGGTAERDPPLSRRVNVDATLALADEVAEAQARFVYASTIAVLGTPSRTVDDQTSPRPDIVYGHHKREVERELETRRRHDGRGVISIRLPGIVARPPVDAGLKSAFMSDIFHALRAHEPYTCPVSPEATVWLMSVQCCISNLMRAADPAAIAALDGKATTLPALQVTIKALIAAAASAFAADPGLIRFKPDAALEAVFGRLPPLITRRADHAGFRHDGDLAALAACVKGDLLRPDRAKQRTLLQKPSTSSTDAAPL